MDNSGRLSAAKLNASDLRVRLGGSGDISIQDLRVDTLRAAIGGSGNFTAAGNASSNCRQYRWFRVNEYGQIDGKNVRVGIGGSGSVETWATDNLNVSIGGSGNVEYYGDPR